MSDDSGEAYSLKEGRQFQDKICDLHRYLDVQKRGFSRCLMPKSTS